MPRSLVGTEEPHDESAAPVPDRREQGGGRGGGGSGTKIQREREGERGEKQRTTDPSCLSVCFCLCASILCFSLLVCFCLSLCLSYLFSLDVRKTKKERSTLSDSVFFPGRPVDTAAFRPDKDFSGVDRSKRPEARTRPVEFEREIG